MSTTIGPDRGNLCGKRVSWLLYTARQLAGAPGKLLRLHWIKQLIWYIFLFQVNDI